MTYDTFLLRWWWMSLCALYMFIIFVFVVFVIVVNFIVVTVVTATIAVGVVPAMSLIAVAMNFGASSVQLAMLLVVAATGQRIPILGSIPAVVVYSDEVPGASIAGLDAKLVVQASANVVGVGRVLASQPLPLRLLLLLY